jgi:hypothetical protein
MNYIIALLAIMAVAILGATFPIPTLVAVVIAAIYWIVKGRKGGVR